MCIMTYLPAGSKITEKEFDNMWENNNHGGGMVTLKNRMFCVHKTLDKDEFHEAVFASLVDNKDSDHVLHFRLASIGERSVENCHPFPINNRFWMAHNGTFNTFGVDSKAKESDTAQVAALFSSLPYNFMKDYALKMLVHEYIGRNKIILFGKDSYIFNKADGTMDDGRWFSNTSYKVTYKSNTVWKGNNHQSSYFKGTHKSYSTYECRACGEMGQASTFDNDLKMCNNCAHAVYEIQITYEVDLQEARSIWMELLNEFEDEYNKPKDNSKIYKDLRLNYFSEKEWKDFIDSLKEIDYIGDNQSDIKLITGPHNNQNDSDWMREMWGNYGLVG